MIGTHHPGLHGRDQKIKPTTQRPYRGDTEGIEFQTPTSWDEGEETTEETAKKTTEEAPTTESPTDDAESEDSLPELVSDDADTSMDSGYAFLNTPPSTEEEDAKNTKDEEREKKKQAMYKEIDRRDEEARMQELTVDFILNMDDPNYTPPEPCIGLTWPLTGKQYYID